MIAKGIIALAERTLLPQDAAEAAAIVNTLDRNAVRVVVREGSDVIGATLANISHRDRSTAHLDLLLVDPAHRRKGVARAMIRAIEEKLRGEGVTTLKVAGNPPDYAWPGVDVRYTEAICALTASGYIHERTAWNMTATTDLTPGNARVPKGIKIRRVRKDDLPLLTRVIGEEWGGGWPAEVERAVTGFGGCHMAMRANRPIAFAAWGATRPSWFGPMGTLPAAKGLGLGGILLRLCLADQAALGIPQAQIGWVGPIDFYAKACGATIERVFFLFHKAL